MCAILGGAAHRDCNANVNDPGSRRLCAIPGGPAHRDCNANGMGGEAQAMTGTLAMASAITESGRS